MKAKLIPMPCREDCYEAWFQEYRERRKYERILEAEENRMKWQSIRNGVLISGIIFLIGFGMYWIVRLEM